ncbi:MAG: hypothetical protein JSU83_16985 [Deltaproteobacteria bacterium]|nr:MAG: hypothetical protein JSU83_16985 [Deltaproteobacteria bacterium]
MKPVYFPFTYISKPVVDALSTFFRQTVIYQPASFTAPENIQNWSQRGLIELRIPISGDEEKLAAILKDYKDWAKLHHDSRGLKNAFIRTLPKTIPFFDETSASRIKADIKKDLQHKASPITPEPVFTARLFLALAQEYDLENERLGRELFSVEAMEKILLKNLHGQAGARHIFAGKINNSETMLHDIDVYMIPERFKAWFQLMHYDREHDGIESCLWITSSHSALTHLLDSAMGAEKICTIGPIPVCEKKSADIVTWQDNLLNQLRPLTTSGEMPAVKVTVPPLDRTPKFSASLTVYLVPGETPVALFSRCAGSEFGSGVDESEGGRLENTLIGYLAAG